MRLAGALLLVSGCAPATFQERLVATLPVDDVRWWAVSPDGKSAAWVTEAGDELYVDGRSYFKGRDI